MTAAQWVAVIGTACAGIGGIMSAYAGIVRAKRETRTEVEIECLERLKAARLSEADAEDEVLRLRRKLATE